MKHFLMAPVVGLLALCALTFFPGIAGAAGLEQVQSVYLMPMANGLDQYLAVRLTEKSTLRVVTDPSKADAVFTDQLGEQFEQRLASLYAGKAVAGKQPAEQRQGEDFARVGGTSHAHGTTFLVDRKTGTVLWSVYERTNGNQPNDVRKRADRVAGKLAAAMATKPAKN